MKEITITKTLPAWADVWQDEVRDMTFITVNTDEVYPKVVELLGGEKDQYWAEVARRCITQYLSDTVGPCNLKLTGKAWALTELPPGADASGLEVKDAAGNLTIIPEFRSHYDRIKGKLGAVA